MAPRTRWDYAGLTASDGQPLNKPAEIEGVPFLSTTKMPIDLAQGTASDASEVIGGDFSQLMIGMRQTLRIQLLPEWFAETLEVGFMAYLRADIQVAQPGAFARIVGISPSA